jgi:hypothetical protein
VIRSIRAAVAASVRTVVGASGGGEGRSAMTGSVRGNRPRQMRLVTIFDAGTENFCEGTDGSSAADRIATAVPVGRWMYADYPLRVTRCRTRLRKAGAPHGPRLDDLMVQEHGARLARSAFHTPWRVRDDSALTAAGLPAQRVVLALDELIAMGRKPMVCASTPKLSCRAPGSVPLRSTLSRVLPAS